MLLRLGRGDYMERLLEARPQGLILCCALLAMLVAVAIYAIRKVRANPLQQEPAASELMSKFRESHSRGELSDEEFRMIKTTLAVKLREELNGNGQTGYDR